MHRQPDPGRGKGPSVIAMGPVNMALKLHEAPDLDKHDIFIGEPAQTCADEAVLKDGKIDIAKVRPLLLDMASIRYWSLGPPVGKCWNAGKSLKR